jgi:hypothetical protein
MGMIGFSLSGQSTSPEVVSSGGAHFSNATHQVSFTIGEPVIATQSAAGNTITQGFHQTRLEVISLGEIPLVESVKVYPNPVVQSLTISSTGGVGQLSVHIYATDGKLVLSKKITAEGEEIIDVSHLAKGSYSLQLIDSNQSIQTFSIIKTQ